MYTISQLQDIISQKISSLNLEKEPKGLYEPISYTLASGGKRIRPALLLAACNMFSDNIDRALSAALAFEIFHNFTLLHDDIMDNSPIRRNKPTVHKKWSRNTAILSGDAMMIESYSLLSELPDENLKILLKLFNKTASEVCEGQQYDMDFENCDNVSEEKYLNMIKLKTSVLIAAALKTGAVLGGADAKDADLLYNFGLNLGLAFQIQDDLLDAYGNTVVFGKKTGNDIITGKKTFLLIAALQKSDFKLFEKLRTIIKNKKIEDQEKIDSVMKIYNGLKIKDLTERKINFFHAKALKYLKIISCKEEKKTVLLEFADMIMKRKK
ncbi:MAG: polyprenyl synthetase family protein [Bacteroidales bacterium]|nr:polyprenyl synthetase family protein [Bacteroidales bacterium]